MTNGEWRDDREIQKREKKGKKKKKTPVQALHYATTKIKVRVHTKVLKQNIDSKNLPYSTVNLQYGHFKKSNDAGQRVSHGATTLTVGLAVLHAVPYANVQ